MSLASPARSQEPLAGRGEDIYNRALRSLLEANHKGEIVAIDIETGEYELGANVLLASKALRARNPDAKIWAVKMGCRAAHRIGPRSKVETP